MSSPDVNFPEPTQQEKDLQAEQLAVLRESRTLQQEQLRVQNLLLPTFFEASGFDPVFEDGKLVSIKRQEPTEEDTLRASIEKGFLERTQAALAGNLPVNPALERELREGEETLREGLRKQLGPGFETSTPGIEALSEFRTRGTELREGARRGDLTLAEQLGLARETSNEARLQDFLNRLGGGANFFTGSIGGLGDISSRFNAPIAQGFNERQGQFQANLENQSTLMSDLLGLGGTLGGAALGSGLSLGALFGCWVAREIYGNSDPRWVIFRRWLLNEAPSWFCNLYIKYGERFALWLRGHKAIKRFIKRWMDKRIEGVLNNVT